jgi:hypothetical protein
MSKQYKLLKELPRASIGDIYYYIVGDKYRNKNNPLAWDIHFADIQNNPEWFEEVKPMEWEVVAYNYGGSVYEKNVGHFFNRKNKSALSEYQLKDRNSKIHSVKRLSNGEVFTVGDEVATNNGRARHKILRFKIIDGDMCVELEGFKCQYEFLSKISKPPPRKERIEVGVTVSGIVGQIAVVIKNNYTEFPSSKLPAIKSAIEEILNGKPGNIYASNGEHEYYLDNKGERLFTWQQLEEVERLAFESARGLVYGSFSDYKNRKQQQ